MSDPGLAGAAAQDDARHALPPTLAGPRHHSCAVFGPVETFDLPDVRLNSPVLQLGDGLEQEVRTKLEIVAIRVTFDRLQLLPSRWHQKLEQEFMAVLLQPRGQGGETTYLFGVRLALSRVVSHQDLDEIRFEPFDVGTEFVAVLERKLFLTACFDGHGQQHPSFPS